MRERGRGVAVGCMGDVVVVRFGSVTAAQIGFGQVDVMHVTSRSHLQHACAAVEN